MASVTLTDEQRETVILEYAKTGFYRAAARAAGVAPNTARKVVAEADALDPEHPVAQMRTQKRVDLAETLGDVEIALARALMDPRKIAEASLDKVAVSLGIVIDKRQLVTGKPTQRTESNTFDPTILTPQEREQAAAIRERFAVASAI